MSRAARGAAALAILAIVFACADTAAAVGKPPSSNTKSPWCNRTFKLWSNATQALVKFHGKIEPGETLAYGNAVYMGTDKVAMLVGGCTILQAVDVGLLSFCNMDIIADADEGYFGTISVQGEVRSVDASVSYLSIVGGTRAYKGASGELKLVVTGARVDYTVSLEKPPCARV
ncbi:hypothetical protein TSOC_012677 [Tetrabaena socialis]|uniref:Dirigent protein n=1 Tax=Tetrabaena socialis TaxID=47790 RepID=A0A2J7ZMD6_9CHLO|nr:hypothetical protein TSOC_012677 [Tetrabaena socialis]|eukprot:PNH01434.1 hypothetical protein TSOC_012677 [Tetrabaena socialis]